MIPGITSNNTAADRAARTFIEMTQQTQAPQQSQQGNGKGFGNQPAPTCYLNIGFMVPFQHEDGTEEMVYVTYPKGIPIDPMEFVSAGPNNKIGQTKNKMIKGLKDIMGVLDSGEAYMLPFQLVGEVRRVGVAGVNEAHDHERHTSYIDELFNSKKTA